MRGVHLDITEQVVRDEAGRASRKQPRAAVKPYGSSSDKLIPLQTVSMDVFPSSVQHPINFPARSKASLGGGL